MTLVPQIELLLHRQHPSARMIPRVKGMLGTGAIRGFAVSKNYEADMVMISAGEVTEFEIKTSLSDFRADFKKPKHAAFAKLFERGLYLPHAKEALPNRFYFVLPAALGINQVPSYAGLLLVHQGEGGEATGLELLSKAPRLHSRLCSPEQWRAFGRSLHARYWQGRTAQLQGQTQAHAEAA